MKLASYRMAGPAPKTGAVLGGRIIDLAGAAERWGEDASAFGDMLALIAGGERALDQARRLIERAMGEADLAHPLDAVMLMAPVPVPPQIRDFSAFPEHLMNAPIGMAKLAARLGLDALGGAKPGDGPRELPAIYRQQPVYYKGNRFNVVGTGTDVRWPKYSRFMDFELEFGVFIGKSGRDIPASEARAHIFGYTIFNDFSARDAQLIEMRGLFGPAKGKDFDTGNVIGPWIVTADEIPNPYALKMAARVNGETWASGTSAGMAHTFEDMIAHVSQSETLYPGEFFGSGTMGTGCGLEQDRYLTPGDIVELEVEAIGTLTNRIIAV